MHRANASMAAIEVGARPRYVPLINLHTPSLTYLNNRDTLPSISHLHFDKSHNDHHDRSRYYLAESANAPNTAPLTSPTSMHSGPPPPYSCAPSTAPSVTALSGYISPPESTTRRSTRDEKESPGSRKSLPSIHEALGAPLAAPPSQHQPSMPHSTGMAQSFPEAPRGPVNPYSQSSAPPPVLRDVFSGGHKTPSTQAEANQPNPSYSPTSGSDTRHSVSHHFGYPGSPRSHAPPSFRSSSLANTSFGGHNEPPPTRSEPAFEGQRNGFAFSQYNKPTPAGFPPPPPSHEPYQFTAGSKPEDPRPPHSQPGSESTYGDTVKRHLDVFDAEMGLGEIFEASSRTSDFSRIWSQRYHSNNHPGFFQESLPGLHEIDDMLRQSHRIFENLTHLREVVVAQQTAMSEQRARLARGGPMDEDYHGLSDDYKNGGFSAGDAKKRRGKAAPPGRCHSCNRAETPEWRRGPDGARTLCNACGLHYAKLTRKMGVNKAAAMSGSNLRPKSLDSTRP
ncbi:hypothetical protein PV10_02392 [Exophiala mesophila]|uniref:GATA-type domain-containing protein n=1 Tax=Exophiala mesophila TaxID=212818 RepID=A0A0D1WYT5_EXOME|nr:uncharacterized protein PV10_02392 [Exophiala mesophila]KIV94645.1 hypothetical protein PV10_02392 [Exophiala mesophila]